MKIYYQLEGPAFNGGIGILPISLKLVYTPTKVPLYSLPLLYDEIKETHCLDLIIQGPITDESSAEGLSWLTPKLISEGYFISYLTHMNEGLPSIIFTQYVLNTDIHILRRKKDLNWIKGNTIIILKDKAITELRMSRKLLLDANVKSKIMFDETLISKNLILEEGVYDLIPYGGI